MKRLFVLAAALFCSLAFSGCGGGGTGSQPSAIPNRASPSGTARAVRDVCTPDSYGYCLTLNGSFSFTEDCGGGSARSVHATYTLYYYGNPDGTFVKTTDNCDYSVTWSPDDPAVVTGDPNLP